MNMLSLWLAWRSFRSSTFSKGISPMVLVCFLGIFIGTFSLALVTAIMHGFQIATHEKMQGVHAQIIIRAYGNPLAYESIKKVIRNEFPEVIALSPSSIQHVLVQSDDEETMPSVMILKAIDSQQEKKVSNINKKIVSLLGNTTFENAVSGNQILIGKTLANDLGITVGDEIEIFFTPEHQPQRKKIILDTTEAIVGGIFHVGLEEYDSNVILCSLEFLSKVYPETGIEQINIKLQSNADEAKIIKRLQDRLGLEVYSWKHLYPALVSALALEKYVAFFILALIALVASMNIISLLFMHITQKRGTIAILKAMGMSSGTITHIFLTFGLIVSTIASIGGLMCAVIAAWLLQRYPFIKLPDVYYVTYLPVNMNMTICLVVFGVVTLLAFFATWLPSRRTKLINIVEVLRFEG